MNIDLSTLLQCWLRKYRGEVRGDTPTASTITSEQRRIPELEKQVRQLQSDNDPLKNGFSLLRHGNEQRQKVAMRLKKTRANLQQVCRCLSLTRSVFYARSRRPALRTDVLMLHAAVKHVHAEIDATYGSRRMCIELREQGFNVGRYPKGMAVYGSTIKDTLLLNMYQAWPDDYSQMVVYNG